MSTSPGEHHELSEKDRRVLDELVGPGLSDDAVDRLPPEDRTRAEKALSLLGLLRDYPVEDADEALTHATLALIDREEESRSAPLVFEPPSDGDGLLPRRRRIYIPDLISVAALLLIAAGIFLPLLGHSRERSLDQGCANNLRHVGFGFSNYAADHGGAMPVVVAGAGLSWDLVANSDNLAPLVAGGYCEQNHLNCPGGHGDGPLACGYSYQWQTPGTRARWNDLPRRRLVLADRNPLIDAYRSGQRIHRMALSFSHGGRGQNALVSDGSILWMEVPVIGRGDNIWLTEGQSTLEPGAKPASLDDVFLVH